MRLIPLCYSFFLICRRADGFGREIWDFGRVLGGKFGAPEAPQGGNLGRRRRSQEGIESAAGAPEAPILSAGS